MFNYWSKRKRKPVRRAVITAKTKNKPNATLQPFGGITWNYGADLYDGLFYTLSQYSLIIGSPRIFFLNHYWSKQALVMKFVKNTSPRVYVLVPSAKSF